MGLRACLSNLNLMLICILSSQLSFAGTKEQRDLVLAQIKSPNFAVQLMNSMDSQWEYLKILRRHMSKNDFNYLKLKGDFVKTNYKNKTNIIILNKNTISIDGRSVLVSQNGEHLIYKGKKLSYNNKESLRTNYEALEKLIRSSSQNKVFIESLFPKAYAASAEDSTTYNLMLILKGLDVLKTSPGEMLMGAFAKEGSEAHNALVRIGNARGGIQSISCDELGMTVKYKDQSSGYVTFENKKPKISENGAGNSSPEDFVKTSKKQTNSVELGWSKYCQGLSPEDQQPLIDYLNQNLFNPQTFGEGGTVHQ